MALAVLVLRLSVNFNQIDFFYHEFAAQMRKEKKEGIRCFSFECSDAPSITQLPVFGEPILCWSS